MRKKPIDSLELFYEHLRREKGAADIVPFNSKRLKKLLRDGYCVDTVSELWYDEGSLTYNNWIDEYSEGIWDMSQKDVDNMARYATRKFSHLTQRSGQKVIPRAYKTTRGNFMSIHLYMRDREYCDYVLLFRKRGNKNGLSF